jgi:hypothetical protein
MVPPGMEIRVVEETASVRYLVLPRNTTQLSKAGSTRRNRSSSHD